MLRNKETVITVARYVARLLVALNLGGELPPLPEGISLRDVYSFSKRHSIASAVYAAIEGDILSSGDSELINRFVRECEIDCAKNLVHTSEFNRVVAAFTDAEIPFLPMKGFLFKALWARPEWRTMADMDIFVSEGGINAAAKALESIGYVLDHGGKAHDCYVKAPYVNIELHKLLDKDYHGSFSEWHTKEENPFWYLMSDEDFLIYVIAHMKKHYASGGFGMRALFDVYLYLTAKGNALDAKYIEDSLVRSGNVDFYRDITALAELWFGGRMISDERILELEAYIASGGTYGTIDNKVATSIKGKSRLGYYLSRFFLPYRTMVDIYGWLRRFPFLLPVAWVMRICRALADGRLGRELKAVNTAVNGDEEK